jgi:cytochrome c556
MNRLHIARPTLAGTALIMGVSFFLAANAQTPPAAPPAPSPAKQAVEVRKAVYTLIGSNFRPIGGLLQGRAQYDAAEFQKRIDRIAFLTDLAGEAFPDISNSGLPDTKAKADVWSDRTDFDKRLKDFQEHAKVLSQVNAKEKSATDAFKAAAGALAQDCKGCHDKYREK